MLKFAYQLGMELAWREEMQKIALPVPLPAAAKAGARAAAGGARRAAPLGPFSAQAEMNKVLGVGKPAVPAEQPGLLDRGWSWLKNQFGGAEVPQHQIVVKNLTSKADQLRKLR